MTSNKMLTAGARLKNDAIRDEYYTTAWTAEKFIGCLG